MKEGLKEKIRPPSKRTDKKIERNHHNVKEEERKERDRERPGEKKQGRYDLEAISTRSNSNGGGECRRGKRAGLVRDLPCRRRRVGS